MHVTVDYIKNLDRLAIESFGFPSLVLMDNAGRLVFEEVCKLLNICKGSKVSVICGVGNNAGDGFVVACYLVDMGLEVQTFVVGDIQNIKSDAQIYLNLLKNMNGSVHMIPNMTEDMKSCLKLSDVIVDAIFGVGLNRDVKDPYYSLIRLVNDLSVPIISVDVPSGMNATTGDVFVICIKAYCTVTFTYSKTGFRNKKAKPFLGEVVVADIGIPKFIKQVAEKNLKEKLNSHGCDK